jgi:hypothetical protein
VCVCVCVCVFVASERFFFFCCCPVSEKSELGFESLSENRVFGASQCLNGLVTNSEGPRAL